MRLHRFYIEQQLAEGKIISLHSDVLTDSAIIHQWKNVFRLKAGERVILFDGSGFDYEATISVISKDDAQVEISKRTLGITPSRPVWLFVSILKKDHFEWVVEKATEIGVSHIVPIESVRTEKKSLNIQRLHTIACESSEQSGRTDVPHVYEPISLVQSFDIAVKHNINTNAIFVADIGGVTFADLSEKPTAIYIGPEGGWDEKDRVLFADKKIQSISFGSTVLRAETAAVVAAAFACL